jgi:hypothetical protein
MRLAALILASLCFSSAAMAAKRVSLVCSFPSQGLTLTFVLDPDILVSKKMAVATLVGNAGTSEVWAVSGSNAISFVEPLSTGVVQTTTISLPSRQAIHSRHTIMGFDKDGPFVPSQSVGTCKVLD